MTYEEALKFANDKILAYDSEMADFLVVCKEALKKQIPRKPRIEYWENRVPSEQKVLVCPTCREIEFWRNQPKACPNCTQVIDWSEDE